MIVAARVYAVNSIARLRAACFWGVFRVGVLCFAHHLDRAEVFGFNPYEIYNRIYPKDTDLGRKNNKIGDSLEEAKLIGTEAAPLDNPGFAPLAANDKKGDYYPIYNGITFAACTSPFNIKRVSASAPKTGLRHTGVDLAPGGQNTDIISFVYGTVWDCFDDKNYGNVMFIKNDNENLLYMLCHLQSFLVKKDDKVTPWQAVAITGRTGKWGGTGIHLHLEVREINTDDSSAVYTLYKNEKSMSWNSNYYHTKSRRNAFRHSETYKG